MDDSLFDHLPHEGQGLTLDKLDNIKHLDFMVCDQKLRKMAKLLFKLVSYSLRKNMFHLKSFMKRIL